MKNPSLIPEYAIHLSPDHPVAIYLEENRYLKGLLAQFSQLDLEKDFQLTYNLFNQIAAVDIRYTRKENQFFPYLEKRGWFGPSQGMWQFQDGNRALIKSFRAKLEARDFIGAKNEVENLIEELYRMISVEETRLLPYALEILLPEDWESMKVGEVEIGWMHKKAQTKEPAQPLQSQEELVIPAGVLKMSEGLMTLDQINLLLQFIPFDLTYVDENDRVIFYNRGEERVFPRSAGVIGREVRFCHPPKSVGTVLEIVEEFRSGRKDVAEFWINYKGTRTIHIRYFAIRDKDKNYRGVIEVSQDITQIKKIEGQRRLLNWEPEPVADI